MVVITCESSAAKTDLLNAVRAIGTRRREPKRIQEDKSLPEARKNHCAAGAADGSSLSDDLTSGDGKRRGSDQPRRIQVDDARCRSGPKQRVIRGFSEEFARSNLEVAGT